MCHFWAQNDPFTLKKTFFRKTIDTIFMYLSVPLLCKILKRSLEWIQSYDDTSFFGPKMTQLPWVNFFPEKSFV